MYIMKAVVCNMRGRTFIRSLIEDSNQSSKPVLPCSPIRFFVSLQNVRSENSDQTAQVCRLIRIFARRTCPKVRFLRLRLVFCRNPSICGVSSQINYERNSLKARYTRNK